jgi:hypothetical protein
MYTISVKFQPTMKVNIHNQCLDFNLMDRRYLGSGAYWNEHPYWKLDTNNMMSTDMIPFLSTFGGFLTYELEKKYTKPDDLSESNACRLYIGWKSENYKELHVFVQLIEYDKTFSWDKIKLKDYYQRCTNQLSTYTDPIRDTWLIFDGTVLMTELELDFTQRDGVLNITISEGVEDEYTRKSVWIDPKM